MSFEVPVWAGLFIGFLFDLELLKAGIRGGTGGLFSCASLRLRPDRGVKVDTIRYYEAEGLVPNVMRGSDGQRRFSPENVDWLKLLYWLRETGVPMKVMQQFAALYAQGDETIPDRKCILLDHSRLLTKRRDDLDRCDEILSRKLDIYEEYLR